MAGLIQRERIASGAVPFTIPSRDANAAVNVGTATKQGQAVSYAQAVSLGGGDFLADGSVPMTGDIDLGAFYVKDVAGLKVSATDPFVILDAPGTSNLLELYSQGQFVEWDFYFGDGATPGDYGLQLTSAANSLVADFTNARAPGGASWRLVIADADGDLQLKDGSTGNVPIRILSGVADALIALDANGIGLFGAAPVAQHALINNVAGGATVDAEGRAAVNALLAALRSIGIIAT